VGLRDIFPLSVLLANWLLMRSGIQSLRMMNEPGFNGARRYASNLAEYRYTQKLLEIFVKTNAWVEPFEE